MSSYTKLAYHIVFGTKYRKPWLKSDLRERIYACIGKLIRDRDGCLLEIGGIEDHVHMLTRLSPRRAIAEVIGETKASASKWINDQAFLPRKFRWQKGYSAFTVSHSLINDVRFYIQNQEHYHQQMTYQDEYISLLRRHDIEFRPEYLFEDEYVG